MEHKYIDLALPSGTLWANENEEGYFSYEEAVEKYGNSLPSKEDFQELIDNTYHKWDKELKGMWFVSMRDLDKKIFLPAASYRDGMSMSTVCGGYYWSSTYYTDNIAYYLYFGFGNLYSSSACERDYGQSVRLIKHNK